MPRLFDPAQPYLASWLQLHDVDDVWFSFGKDDAERGSLLYYASLCGFHDLAARIITDHPEQVNAARGGRNHKSTGGGTAQVAFQNYYVSMVQPSMCLATFTELHFLVASEGGLTDVARWSLDHGADVDSQDDEHFNPILTAAAHGSLNVVRMLLEQGVRVNSATDGGVTPLYNASTFGSVEIMRLLLQHGADVSAQDEDSVAPCVIQ
jgi:hypothetical protein